MKVIKVKNREVLIPDSWEDLDFKEKLFTFRTLMRVMNGDLKDIPHHGLLLLLLKYTGYKPASFRFRRFRAMTAYYLKCFWIHILNIMFLAKYGWKEYREYAGLLKAAHRPDPDAELREKEIIDLGLLRLAGTIDFVYRIDTENKKIIPQYAFHKNPFPVILINGKKYDGKRLYIDVIAVTNITARCFVDTLDILMLMEKMTSRDDKNICINRICAILYPAISDHRENMLSATHIEEMKKLDPAIKFGVVYWFTGVVNMFREHETYSVIFDRIKDNRESGAKISIGMNEIALFLKKEGYGDPENMNLIDYFDAQVKALKDYISQAIACGVKISDIAQKTGVPLHTIDKLS